MTSSTTIPKGSRVLVTGGNGFTASHIINTLLGEGFKVRGTVRDDSRAAWMKEFWDTEYGDGSLDFALVPEMGSPGAYDEAVKDTAGIIHVASNLSFSPDPKAVIPETVDSTKSALKAAAATPTIKSFVLTSSAGAVAWPRPNERFTITAQDWNNEAVERSFTSPTAWDVYGASKVLSERAMWDFVRKERPGFRANAVIPNAIWGPVLAPGKQDKISAAGFVAQIWENGSPGWLESVPPQHHVDVRDVARLHVATLVDPEIVSERIFAYGEPYNWNKVMACMRKITPNGKTFTDVPGLGEDKSIIEPRPKAEAILKKHFGRGFTGMEETVRDNVKHLSQMGDRRDETKDGKE